VQGEAHDECRYGEAISRYDRGGGSCVAEAGGQGRCGGLSRQARRQGSA